MCLNKIHTRRVRANETYPSGPITMRSDLTVLPGRYEIRNVDFDVSYHMLYLKSSIFTNARTTACEWPACESDQLSVMSDQSCSVLLCAQVVCVRV